MNLLLLTFGSKLENHYQAAFCILTFLKDSLVRNVLIITDRPDFYRFFDQRVQVISIDDEKLREWEGEHKFFWRVKIKALEYAFQKYPNEHLIYVDSDTFLANRLNLIKEDLDNGVSFMHMFEHYLSKKNSNTTKKMLRHLGGRDFCGIHINGSSEMWNAGVIALPKEKAKDLITLSLNVCDEMCRTDSPRRLIEQFSFSVSLKHLGVLKDCDRVIGHYWGNKEEWNNLIKTILVSHHLKNKTLQEQVDDLKGFDFSKIALVKKSSNTSIKLKEIIESVFKIKEIRYF